MSNVPSLDERRRAASSAVCRQHVVCQEVSGFFLDAVESQIKSPAAAGFAACGAGWGVGLHLSEQIGQDHCVERSCCLDEEE